MIRRDHDRRTAAQRVQGAQVAACEAEQVQQAEETPE